MALEVALNGGKSKAMESDVATVRLEIDLGQSASGNEFSYIHLIQEAQDKQDGDDPLLTEEDAKLAAIAKGFEEKYAPKKKKPRVMQEQDLVDIGYGYDTNDSFVDDSEVYEDYVPPNVDTVHGGFYINTGDLQFKQTDTDYDTDNSDSGMMTFFKESKARIKKHTTPNTKTSLANKKIKLAKQQLANSTQRSNSYKKKLSSLTQKSITPKTLTFTLSKGNKKSTVVGGTDAQVPRNGTDAQTTCDGMDTQAPSEGTDVQTPRTLPTLPPDLPQDILQLVTQLDQSIAKDQKDGKLSNKARDGYDTAIADIKTACKSLNQRTATTVIEYIACKMGITRQSLLSRLTRKLKRKDATALEGPLQQLKEAVEKAMPPLLEKYEEEIKQYGSLSAIKDEPMATDDSMTNDVFADHHGNAEGPPQTDVLKPKRPRPRKRFEWTQEIKELVNEVIRIKVELEMSGLKTRPSNGEDIILKFIDLRIKSLWPRGWIQRSMVYKLTEASHSAFTGGKAQRAKKLSTAIKKPVISPSVVSTTPSATPSVTTITSNLKPMLVTTKKSPPVSTTATSDVLTISTQNLQSVLKHPKLTLGGNLGGVVKSKPSPKPRPLSASKASSVPVSGSSQLTGYKLAGRGVAKTSGESKLATVKKSVNQVPQTKTITVSPDVYRALLQQVIKTSTPSPSPPSPSSPSSQLSSPSTSSAGSHFSISQLLKSATSSPSPVSVPRSPSLSPALVQATPTQATPTQTLPTVLRPSVVSNNVSPRKLYSQVLNEHSYTTSSSQAPRTAPPHTTQATKTAPPHTTQVSKTAPPHTTQVPKTAPPHTTQVPKTAPPHTTQVLKTAPPHTTQVPKAALPHTTQVPKAALPHTTQVAPPQIIQLPQVTRLSLFQGGIQTAPLQATPRTASPLIPKTLSQVTHLPSHSTATTATTVTVFTTNLQTYKKC